MTARSWIATLPAAAAVACLLVSAGCGTTRLVNPSERLTARLIDSGFAQSHDSYNGISAASDGNIYYVLSSDKADVAAQMYCYDSRTEKVRHLGDLTEASGEKGSGAIAQGKSHVSFAEADGKLYFATHIGYYDITAVRLDLEQNQLVARIG